MSLKTWGNYPLINNQIFSFANIEELKSLLSENEGFISYGNGRCYGDSALYKRVLHTNQLNHFIHFDSALGFLTLESGVLLSEILDLVIPFGFFLQVSPGTKLITVGGAIASDVHGKNHHKIGCFSECVESFRLMIADGTILECSRHKNQEFFKATCGGMGLTGVILEATLKLKKIPSIYIKQKTYKTRNLEETFVVFEEEKEANYSVAWIDCLASGKSLGRSLVMIGDWAHCLNIESNKKKSWNVPFYFPSFTLNSLSVKSFNFLYYHKQQKKVLDSVVTYNSFFYPLDSIKNWNRIYGKKGFTQYQFILPKDSSYIGLTKILSEISKSGKGSFLAVLKLYGSSNENYLSFPIEGYSLALDFKIESGLFDLLERLDKMVLNYGGRIYLAKDARVSRETIAASYPQIDKFKELRERYHLNHKFNSLQSVRIGI